MSRVITNSYATDVLRDSGPAAAALVRAAKETVVRLFDTLAEWQGRSKERRHLMELDTRLLRDAGLTRADAFGEHAKPFWRP